MEGRPFSILACTRSPICIQSPIPCQIFSPWNPWVDLNNLTNKLALKIHNSKILAKKFIWVSIYGIYIVYIYSFSTICLRICDTNFLKFNISTYIYSINLKFLPDIASIKEMTFAELRQNLTYDVDVTRIFVKRCWT